MDSISELPPPPPEIIVGEVVGNEPGVAATPAATEQVYNSEGDAASLASVDR